MDSEMNNNVLQTGEETAEKEAVGEISAAEQELTVPDETVETAFEEAAGDTESAEEAEEETDESENGKEDVICPNCGRECAWIYVDHNTKEILGCDECIDEKQAWKVPECFPRKD